MTGFAPEFVAQVAASGVGPAYYALCRDHPLRLDTPPAKTSARVVLKAARGRMELHKIKGPEAV